MDANMREMEREMEEDEGPWFTRMDNEIARLKELLAQKPWGSSTLNPMIAEFERQVNDNRRILAAYPQSPPLFAENEKVAVELSWDYAGWVLVVDDKSPPPPNTLPMLGIWFLPTYAEGKRLFEAALAGEPLPPKEDDND